MKRLKRNLFSSVVFVFWLVTTVAGAAETETDYLAILLKDQKIGHAVHIRSVEDNKVTTTERFSMTLGRGGQAVTVSSQETHIESTDGKPLGFELSMTTSGIEQKTIGTVKDGTVTVSRQVMGQAQQQTASWPEGALLSEGMRILQEEKGLETGTAYEVLVFRPDMLSAVTAQVVVGEKKDVDLFGVLTPLTEVQTVMSIQGEEISMTGYVDEDLKVKKTQVPMLNMTLTMIACDKAFAMQEDDIVDFLDKLSIASPVKLMNLPKAESGEYLLEPTGEKELELVESSSQSVQQTPEGIRVTVTKIKPENPVAFPYPGDDPEALEALKATDYLQSNDPTIIEMAKTAVGDTKDALEAGRQIEAFVDGYIVQKDLSVGYASASEVARNRQGDCSEHAVLVAAMCRAVGIPARIVCGVVYADSFLSKQSIFGGHMWTEIYLDGQWVGLDATRSEQGFGPGYIALSYGNGEPTDFFSLINTLGYFKIKSITLDTKKVTPEPVSVQ